MADAGVIVINKEKGYTSHDVVEVVRKTLGVKAGHTGTLDPQAEGVLPICLGRATKLTGVLTDEDKTYVAETVLGVVTDSCDMTGETLETRPVCFDEARIREVVAGFVGEQLQTPPMYSAVKINGKKLYELARAGQTVERTPRPIYISDIEILQFNPEANAFTLRVSCSKGTYIRTLCADIGEKLGCGAAMGALTRTRTGLFTLADAVTLDVFKKNPDAYIWPVEKAFPCPRAYVQPEMEAQALHGNPIPMSRIGFTVSGQERYWLYYHERQIGLYKLAQNRFLPEAVML